MTNNEMASKERKGLVDQINKHVHGADAHYYEIGVLLNKYVKDKPPEHQQELIRSIVEDERIRCFEAHVQVCYNTLRLFPGYTPDDPLSFSHYVALAGVEDEAERERFRKAAIVEGWSLQELRRKVSAYEDGKAGGEERLLECRRHVNEASEGIEFLLKKCNGDLGPELTHLAGNAVADVKYLLEKVCSLSAKLTKRWREQLFAKRAEAWKSSEIPESLILEPEDYRWIKAKECEEIVFPKHSPRTNLHRIFKATRYLLDRSCHDEVRLQYRPGVWATYYDGRKKVIQLGERCIEAQFNAEKNRSGRFEQFGAKPGLEYLALTLMEQVTHAVFGYGDAAPTRPHGPIFRFRLKEMHHDRMSKVLAILSGEGLNTEEVGLPMECHE